MGDHVHRFRMLHNCFKSNVRSTPGIVISDHYIAILLFKSLLSEYNSLVQTTLAFSLQDISLSRVYSLLQMGTTRLQGISGTGEVAYLVSRPKDRQRERK